MPAPAAAAAPWVAMGLQAIGSGITGAAGASAARKDRRSQERIAELNLGQNYAAMGRSDRQFGQNSNLERSKYLDERALAVPDLQKRLAMLPVADRAAYMIAQRAGAVPGAFQARDHTRGSMPGTGNVSGGYAPILAQMQEAAGKYQSGMGGLDPSGLRDAIARLRSNEGVPEMYEAADPARMRLEADLANALANRARAVKPQDIAKWQQQVDAIKATLAQMDRGQTGAPFGPTGGGASSGGGMGGPTSPQFAMQMRLPYLNMNG